MAMQHTMEYHSLHYLNNWLKHDKKYHEGLQSKSSDARLQAIKAALTYYKIARNLPKAFDQKIKIQRYEPVLNILDGINAISFQNSPIQAIKKLEQKISDAYNGRNVLSLTTKLAWLKMPEQIIIYDSQARKALATKNGDLTSFYEAWQKEYQLCRRDIKSACDKLDKVAQYSWDIEVATPKYIKQIAKTQWFQRRVFDSYLWHKGL
jgi:uncharacterized protein with von Willebrand factor type A (vWA) domain